MAKALFSKMKEAAVSVLPVVLIVLLLYFTPFVDLTSAELTVFLICALVLILGIGLFNLGADLAMMPMGEHVGGGLAKTGKLKILLSVCFVMGLLITIAEPDLSVLAEQVSNVMNGTLLIVTVGVGVGLFLLLSCVKIVFKKNLSALLLYFYLFLFAIAALLLETGKGAFLPLAFDSGGVTTGPITVPFIMALGVGIAGAVGGKDANENSFGLVALCSIGPILAVLCLCLTSTGELSYATPDYSINYGAGYLLHTFADVAFEVLRALGLIFAVFGVLQVFMLKLPKKKLLQIVVGIVYTFIGLVLFLTAVTVGFMPVGYKLGTYMAKQSPIFVAVFAFIIGTVVVLAEPAVHVLKKQVEEITGGAVTGRSMMIALSVGVGTSICLSAIRIIFGFSILYYLIPGYLISLGLSFFVPKIYTAIAFDSGGVASGPLTSSFILPLAIGICDVMQGGGNAILSYAFGVVAMVAMTPLITIQVLGFRAVLAEAVRRRIVMKRILDADDEQIIYFD